MGHDAGLCCQAGFSLWSVVKVPRNTSPLQSSMTQHGEWTQTSTNKEEKRNNIAICIKFVRVHVDVGTQFATRACHSCQNGIDVRRVPETSDLSISEEDG
jgi:regulation of enolase protein 1 (concanavalin A-like superfamily)